MNPTKNPNPVEHRADGTSVLTLFRKDDTPLECLIDTDDYLLVKNYRWWALCDPHSRTLYAVTTVRSNGSRSSLRMHRLLLPTAIEIDHADHNGLNNCQSNLRTATHSQNGANCRKQIGTSIKFKGVNWDRGRKRWMAKIQVKGKPHWLGRFTSESAAARAHDSAALKYFGKFANLNFAPATTAKKEAAA